MYTQCPDCKVAFKVTAETLKQAAGQVRCGSCGNAFNALSYLSEDMPKQPVAKEAGVEVPELKPEFTKQHSRQIQSISAEQSAALLKTLDELAGSDIRIEDTGIEWRVLDKDEATAPAADDDDAGPGAIDQDRDTGDEPDAAPVAELRFDDNTPLPEDFEANDESSYLTASGPSIDLFAEDEEEEEVPDEDEPLDIALSEPDEWQDLLGEFQDLVEEVAAPIEAIETEIEPEIVPEIEPEIVPEIEPEIDTLFVSDEETAMELDFADVAEDESIPDESEDLDAQIEQQAEAMDIDLSGIDEFENDESDTEIDDEFDHVIDDEIDDEIEHIIDDEVDDESDDKIEQLELIEEEIEPVEEPIVENHAIEDELATDEASDEASDDLVDEHYVPPMTEEEHTVNMQIDQDLMALAIEDDDGFASTIIISGKDAEKYGREEASMDDDESVEAPANAPLFETIIMEGASIRSEVDSKKLAVDVAAAAELIEIARAKESKELEESRGPRYGMIAAAVLLVLTLAVQMIHQSREALATMPAFSSTIGQFYRAIGQPVQPAWDITGWRFEATKGSTEGEDEDLTVYSRLGNNSDGSLPYPLIGISLTDRFEESIGSRVLDPAEYLQSNIDPRKLVEPGDTFDAVITIKSASEDATGFKLNVCYRLTDGQLRCAIEDFK